MKKDLHTLGLIACGAKIAAGTVYYAFVEFAKETKVPDGNNGWAKFERPFFGAMFLFFGMSFTLIPYYFMRHNKPGVSKLDTRTFINMILPSLLEFVGQIMFFMGAMSVPMSLLLTLKGVRVVFSAVLLVVFLKRKLYSFHWFAVVCTIAGLVVASIPALVSPSTDKGAKTSGEVATGIALALGGEFIRSLRGVVEEKMMKKMKYDPLLVVGLQGIYALALSIPALFVVNAIPTASGVLEDLGLTWTQFTSSSLIIVLYFTFPICVPGLFISGAYVTKLMSAVHNALTTILTTAIVWLIAIVVHEIDNSRGKALIPLSAVQLLGFLMVLTSSLLYDAILRIPQLFNYPLDRAAASGAGSSEKSVLGIKSTDSIPTNADDDKLASETTDFEKTAKV